MDDANSPEVNHGSHFKYFGITSCMSSRVEETIYQMLLSTYLRMYPKLHLNIQFLIGCS